MNKLQGIFPALLTPFTEVGNLHLESLKKIIELNLSKGVHGFYVGGSTAEAFLLTFEQRKVLISTVSEIVNGRCPLIAHVGCIATEQAIELGQWAQQASYDALSSVPPFYYPFSFEEIQGYYSDLLEHTDLPFILYHFPAFAKVDFSIENFLEILSNPKIIGLKYTSKDLFLLERVKKHLPHLLLYNGFDETFLAGLSMGVDGAIGSTFNVMAEKFIHIQKYFEETNIAEAQKLQYEANDVIQVLAEVGVLQGEKELLELMGIECGGCKKPFRNLTEADKTKIRLVYERYF